MSDIADLGVRFAADFPFFARHCLKVKTKTNAIIPFVLNVAQQYIHARIEEQRARTGRVRAIILKARQEGASTYIEGRYYWRVVVGSGIEAVIIAHEQLASDNLYAMARRYHEHMPDQLKRPLERSNAKELRIGDCLYRVLTAGTQSVGRSLTLTLLHASESQSA